MEVSRTSLVESTQKTLAWSKSRVIHMLAVVLENVEQSRLVSVTMSTVTNTLEVSMERKLQSII